MPAAMAARYARIKSTAFKASPQQQAYFDWIVNGQGSCVLEAVAGAGKTTTIIQGLPLMTGTVFFGAYNKKIADEIRVKVIEARADRQGVFIATLHSYGLINWSRGKPKESLKVDDRKVRRIIDTMGEEAPEMAPMLKLCESYIGKMVSFGKQFLIGCAGKPAIDNIAVWQGLARHFGIDQDLPDEVMEASALGWVMEAFTRSRGQCHTLIDFDDMIYAPIAFNTKLFPNDWVLIDECQDINPARRELAKRMLKSTSRAVFVGDSRQAIYGFTGAGGDSIERITEEFKCGKLPLTVSYRCPKAVVAYAHQWVTHIEAHPDAPDGVVREVDWQAARPCRDCSGHGVKMKLLAEDPYLLAYPKCPTCEGKKLIADARPWFMQDPPTIDDAILCRYTKPLIQTAYAMIKEGIACRVEGRDIGNGLIAITHLWRITSIARLEERLKVYLAREIAKAQKDRSERREQEVIDKVETLRIFIARCHAQGKTQITDLVAEIRSMFDDDVKGVVVLSTVHKAKGREWPRVYWVQTMHRGRPSKDWEAIQEQNLCYVATTRAMKELILVPEPV
jgi:superfamily I DNA/RNA helicase